MSIGEVPVYTPLSESAARAEATEFSVDDLTDVGNFTSLERRDAMFDRLRATMGPVFPQPGYPLGYNRAVGSDHNPAWAVIGHQGVVEVSRNADGAFSMAEGPFFFDKADGAFASGADGMLLFEDSPDHTIHRKLVAKVFHGISAQLPEILAAKADLVIDGVIERGECDIANDLATQLPLDVIGEFLNIPEEERAIIRQTATAALLFEDQDIVPDLETASAEGFNLILHGVEQVAEVREAIDRGEVSDDFITMLAMAELDAGHKLSDEALTNMFALLAVAGSETSRNAIAQGMYALMVNSDQRELLKANPDLIDNAVEEIVRWVSPVMMFRRTAIKDATIQGQPVQAGDKVTLWFGAANRDPDIFTDPNKFDITRSKDELNRNVAFGAPGHHHCLGARLARMEVKAMISTFIERMPDAEITGEMELAASNILASVKSLPIRFTPQGKAA